MPGLSEQRYTPEEFYSLTTDPDEGRRQIEAMQPRKLQVGDKVRLKAGVGPMTVVGLEDYGNMAVCEWAMPYAPAPNEDSDVVPAKPDGSDAVKYRDTFSARSLVLVEPKVG